MTRVCIFLLALASHGVAAVGGQTPCCTIKPAHLVLRVPEDSFTWLAREEFSRACDDVPASRWVRMPSKPVDVWVDADGRSGSGRYWGVTVGVGTGRGPKRGFCLTTSTVGWRTLQRFDKTPLSWVDDSDKDGKAEIVIWDSFPLSEEPSIAEYGLMAWVYEMDSESVFNLDWGLTRKMVQELAAAYRKPLPEGRWAQPLRNKASEALETFAQEHR